MSTTYSGIPGNTSGSLPAAKAIASSTAANPTVITTSAAHGLTTGQVVDVYGHELNLGANGQNVATVTGANTYSIPVNTTGATPGVNTGHVIGLYPGASTNIPADGDVRNAASVNVPFENVMDRSSWLALGLGASKVSVYNFANYSDDTQADWDTFTFAANSTWTPSDSNTTIGTVNAYPFINQGDLVFVEFDLSLSWTTAGSAGSVSAMQLGLYATMAGPGVAFPALVQVPGSVRYFGGAVPASGNEQINMTCHLSSTFVAGSGSFPTGNSLSMLLKLQASTFLRASIASSVVHLQGAHSGRVMVYRPLTVNQ
jgi:hypothetical protein